jgi:hypothetical protein
MWLQHDIATKRRAKRVSLQILLQFVARAVRCILEGLGRGEVCGGSRSAIGTARFVHAILRHDVLIPSSLLS